MSMSNSIGVNLILISIGAAIRDWKRKFKTTTATNELIEAIQTLFYNCTQALIELSTSADGNQQVKQNRIDAERIVSKLKELKYSLGDIWPSNYNSFGRDAFDVGSYHVEAAEFFHPVPFYPGDDLLMKLYRWSVYDTMGTIVCRYHLEKSEIMPGEPYYVLGKSYPNGHSQIEPYGTTVPSYNQMKSQVIDNLTGQGPDPLISSSVGNGLKKNKNQT